MERDFNAGDSSKSSQKFKPKKLIFRIVVVIVAIAAAVGVYFGVQYLIKMNKENADIKVGETVITKDNIDKNTKSMDDYLKKNPDLTFGDSDPSTIARKDLIINAALKEYSKKCESKKGKVSSIDIYNELYPGKTENKTEASAGKILEDYYKSNGEFAKIRLENKAYKTKYQDCILSNKQISRITIIYDTPFFNDLSDGDFKAEVLNSKKKLLDEYIPLLKSKISVKELAGRVDNDTVWGSKRANFGDFSSKPVVSLFQDKWGNEEDSGAILYNDSKVGRAPEIFKDEIVSPNEIIKNLSLGEYSNPIIALNGEVAIYRVESVSGEFADWDEFERKILDKYAVLDSRIALAQSVSVYDGSVHVDRLSKSAGCATFQSLSHYIATKHIFSISGSPGALPKNITDNEVTSTQVPTKHKMRETCALTTSDHADQYGAAYSVMNCLSVNWSGAVEAENEGSAQISYTPMSGYKVINAYGDSIRNDVGNGTTRYSYRTGVLIGANQARMNTINVVLEKNVTPPDDIPYYPNLGSRTNTQVNVNNGSWKYGEGHLAPINSTVRFKHEVYGDVYGGSEWDTATLSWNTDAGQRGVKGLSLPQRGLAYTRTESGRTIVPSDAGKIICDSISATIKNIQYKKKGVVKDGKQAYEKEYVGTGSTSSSSTQACVYVPYDFELIPCVTADGYGCGGSDVPVEPGASVPVTPNISNGGSPTPPGTQYKITTWDIPGSGERVPTPGSRTDNSNGNPCSHYGSQYAGTQLRNCRSETGTRSFLPNTTNLERVIPPIPTDAELGSRYCVALSVSAYRMRNNESKSTQDAKIGREWRHSAPICVLVTKKPKFQIWGNGIYSRSGIRTSRTTSGGKHFGSWVEFEAITNGAVRRFTSESTHDQNRMTFRNGIGTGSGVGNWGNWNGRTNSERIIERFEARYPRRNSGAATQAVFVQDFTNIRNHTIGKIDGTNKAAGNTHIIYADNLTISEDITSRDPSANQLGAFQLGSFQQTIIIAKGNITISPNVRRIDAWLISGGTIRTCSVADGSVSQSTCGEQLRINGPIIAQNLVSRRTAGSSPTNLAEPAEIYNQRADIYMWAKAQSLNDARLITTYTRELPIRL